MKTIVYNQNQLDTVLKDMYQKFDEYQSLQIDYQKPFKEKTLRQLGFFFGALVDSVIDFFHNQGVEWSVEDVKENFYQATAYSCEKLNKTCHRFNGEIYSVPKRLSQMNVEEASIFIDLCIDLIDRAKCFDGLILHPSIRYTWVRHISQDDIYNLRSCAFPREDKAFLEHQRKQACIWCGKQNCSQVHHLKEAGFTGTGYKADDWLSVPLCNECHIKGYHEGGKNNFMKDLEWITKYISIIDFCRINYCKWRNKL